MCHFPGASVAAMFLFSAWIAWLCADFRVELSSLLSASMEINRRQPANQTAKENDQPEPKSMYIHRFRHHPKLCKLIPAFADRRRAQDYIRNGARDYARAFQCFWKTTQTV